MGGHGGAQALPVLGNQALSTMAVHRVVCYEPRVTLNYMSDPFTVLHFGLYSEL